MQYSLMQAIFHFITENQQEFQLTNRTHDEFRAYIYGSDGNFLPHGGEQVSDFIRDAIKLMRDGAKQ